MSLEYRNQLVDAAVSAQPKLSAFIKEGSSNGLQMLGNWDVIALGFSKAFEILWDHAKVDPSGLLLQPLLTLWRQSIELSIKAALVEIEGQLEPGYGHNIEALFERLSLVLTELGYSQDDDELAQGVRAMLTEVQALDRSADRFRYPETKSGKTFEPVDTDLDMLFQAHLLITFYCNAAGDQVADNRQIEYEMRETK